MPAKVQMKRAAWLLLSVVILASLAAAQLPAEYLIYVGTYTEKTGSQGIYAYRFNRRTGEITPVGLAAKTEQPSFLAIPRNGKYLYAVNETNSGEVSAFRIEKDGMLTPLNRVPSGGAHPAHISVDTTGRNVLVANYTGGSVAAFRTQHDGTLTPAAAVVQHQGSSANPERQKGPHAHAIVYAPGEKLAVAVDLGTDELYVYNTAHGRLDRVGSAKVRSGAGPRHLAFHLNGKWAYVINELNSTITLLEFARQSLTPVDTYSTLPSNFTGTSYTAEVVVHPGGEFLYGSNRGHDSIVVYAIAADGRLELVEHTPSGGRRPRNFAIDPSGEWLLAANQDSDTIAIFKIDLKTGRLTETGGRIEVPSPVCVRFLPVRK